MPLLLTCNCCRCCFACCCLLSSASPYHAPGARKAPSLLPRLRRPLFPCKCASRPLNLAAAPLPRLPPPRRSPSGGRWLIPCLLPLSTGEAPRRAPARTRSGSARRPHPLRPLGPMTDGPHAHNVYKKKELKKYI